MPPLSTRSHTHVLPRTAERVHFTVSFVIRSMKIAHLDNPSLSALSAWETRTHPSHSLPHYHMPVNSRGLTTKPKRLSWWERPPASLFGEHWSRCLSDRWPSLERHDTVRGATRKEGPYSAGAKQPKTEHKSISICTPIEESGPEEHLIHFFWRAINLFKHQNHFASQERPGDWVFYYNQPEAECSRRTGEVRPLSLALPFPI